MSFDNV